MSSCCLRWQIFKHSFYSFPLLKCFSFTFLVPFFWNFQKCPFSTQKKSLIKAQLKNCTQRTFQGVVHQQPWSSIVCLLWGSSIVPSCCLRWQIFKHSFYPVPLLKLFSFTFLAPFLWNHQKCPIPQNIWCLVKTQFKKIAPKQFFKGLVHEQPWSSIVCLLWWSSIVSNCCLRWKFSNIPFTCFLC